MSTVQPTRPWVATTADRVRDGLIFVVSIAISYGLVAATPLKGKLAYFFTFFAILTLANGLNGFLRYGFAAAKDAAIKTLVGVGALLTVMPIASILAIGITVRSA